MRRSNFVAVLFLVLLLNPFVIAQTTAPAQPIRTPADRARDRSENDLSRRMSDMRTLEQRLLLATRQPRGVPVEPKLSDEDRQRVLKLRHIDPADIGKYSVLLKQERTGIFKLFPDLGCISKNVVRLTRECERFVPLSSSFTFRTNSYSDAIYHDIYFKDDRISSKSFFSQGIFAVIGEEPLEAIGLSHPALRYLTSYEPDSDPKSAAEHARQFKAGLDSESYRYADSIEPKENVTYAMRMIAYRLENNLKPLSDETSTNEMMFLSLPFDKRLDVIVAFRILGRDEYNGLTIVWKELSREEAAKIKFGKNQALKDFRPGSN